jgi:renalase
MTDRPHVAVIGAGLAGLACARALHEAGWRVTVLDKARGAGGRTSTRRDGDSRFDHGAARLELGAPALAERRAAWEAAGVIVRWQPRIRGADDSSTTWIGVPGANALAVHLARDLDVRTGTKIVALVRDDAWWGDIEYPHGIERRGPFDRVLLTAPAPQARDLIATTNASALAAMLEPAQFAPCFAAMLVFAPHGDTDLDELRMATGPLASAHRMDHRPGRIQTEGLQSWVLHASEPWSRAHLEADPATSAAVLATTFANEVPGDIVRVAGHRWRFARATVRVQAPCAFDAALGLGVAGDWFEAGDRAPASSRALLSGVALAAHVMSQTSCLMDRTRVSSTHVTDV